MKTLLLYYMDRVVLQVPMTRGLRDAASAVADDYGFSSLQELVRVFVSKVAKKQVSVDIIDKPVYLSKRSDARYQVANKDFKTGKDVFGADNVDDLMGQLLENEDWVS